jgi:hypothetical protein
MSCHFLGFLLLRLGILSSTMILHVLFNANIFLLVTLCAKRVCCAHVQMRTGHVQMRTGHVQMRTGHVQMRTRHVQMHGPCSNMHRASIQIRMHCLCNIMIFSRLGIWPQYVKKCKKMEYQIEKKPQRAKNWAPN